jgi:predicted enzyme related to lactoylglutathione lyase
MKRVTGIGGIFFKAKDPKALAAWYKDHLGVDVQSWGGATFHWKDDPGHAGGAATAWSIMGEQSKKFAPGTASFLVNYRVADLHGLIAALKAEGCNVMEKVEEMEYGKFGWVVDPEGNKVELWEPPAGQ